MSNSAISPEVRETGESDSSVWDFLVKKIVSERLDTAESLLGLFTDMQAALLELKKLAERSLTCEKPEEESVSVSLSPIMSSVLGMSQVGGVTRYILPQAQIPEQYHQLLGFPTGTGGGREVDVVNGDEDGDVQLMKSMEKEDENTHPDKAENDSKSVEKDTEERSKSKAELKKPKDDSVTVKRNYWSTKNDSFDSDDEDRKRFRSRSRDRYTRRRRSRSRDRRRDWSRKEREERQKRQREREVTVPVSNPSLRPSQFVPRNGRCSLDTTRSSHPPPPPPERPGVVVRPDAMELEEISSGKLCRLQCTVYRRPLI